MSTSDPQRRIEELERAIHYAVLEIRHIAIVMGEASDRSTPTPDYVLKVYVSTLTNAATRLETMIEE